MKIMISIEDGHDAVTTMVDERASAVPTTGDLSAPADEAPIDAAPPSPWLLEQARHDGLPPAPAGTDELGELDERDDRNVRDVTAIDAGAAPAIGADAGAVAASFGLTHTPAAGGSNPA